MAVNAAWSLEDIADPLSLVTPAEKGVTPGTEAARKPAP